MSAEGSIQDDLAMRQDVSGLTVVNHGGRHQAQPGMVVLMVVPLKEGLAEAAGILDGAEAIRKARPAFQRYGTDFLNTDCHRKHADVCAFN